MTTVASRLVPDTRTAPRSVTGYATRWIAGLAVLHVALAAPALSDSVWLDEAVTIQLCRLPLSLHATIVNDATPPVYYLVAHAWGALFGCGDTGLRILSLVFSVLSGALLLDLGRRWLGLEAGVLAAVLFSVSNLQLRYATEARCYTLVELLLLLSYRCFVTLLEAPTRRRVLALAVVNALLVQTHYVAALGLLPQLAVVVLFRMRERDVRDRYIVSQLLAVALCLPWAACVLAYWPPITPQWLAAPDAGTLRHNFRLLLATPLEPVWYALALVVLLAATALRTPDRLRGGVVLRLTLLAAWGIGVPLAAFAISGRVSVVLPRYLLFTSLGLWLLLAYAVSLAPARGWRRAMLVALLLVPTLAGVRDVPVVRADWRAALAVARSDFVSPTTRMIVSPEWESVTAAYYVLPPDADAFSMDDVVRNLGFEGVLVARDPEEPLAELSGNVRRVILVAADPYDHPVVLAMPQLCALREQRATRLGDLTVRVFDRDCLLR